MSVIKEILLGINNFITSFQVNPYDYLYESDVQCGLFNELRAQVVGNVLVCGSKGNSYALNLIYSEYGQPDLGTERIDLVCLDPEAVVEVTPVSHKGFDTFVYNLPLLVGIELKYLKMGDAFGLEAMERDYEKLYKANNIRNKLMLFFVQDSEKIERLLSKVQAEIVNDIAQPDGRYIVGPTGVWVVGNY